MGKLFMIMLYMNILYSVSFGQINYVLKGLVVDENNQALTGASVFLYPIKEGTITDYTGEFAINNLQKGSYVIEISFIGYNTHIDTINISEDKTYNVQLRVATLSLQEVIVTDNYAETRKKEESLNIEIVNDDYLKQNLGGSIMKSLERLPGVTTIDIGSGQSKPVIRGLGFNRVVVVENSIKHEAQQWGTDHGLEIDQYAIDNIEIIKGPASLMYGPDAIGGVIDIKDRILPPAENSFGGTVDLSGKTNNDFFGTSILMYGKKNWFFTKFRATIVDYGDYKVPTDSVNIYSYRTPLYKNHLRNTAGKEQNVHISFGVIQKRYHSKFYLSNVNSKSGFFANAHGLEPLIVDAELHDNSNRDINYPYHTVNHFKFVNTSHYKWKKLKLEFDLGFQHNFRKELSKYRAHSIDMPTELPDTLGFEPHLEKQFKKLIYSGNIKTTYSINNAITLNAGINAEYTNNQIDGWGFIIPEFKQFVFGGFALTKYSFTEKSILQFGVRYDYGKINTESYFDWYPSQIIHDNDTILEYKQRAYDLNLNFSNISWSFGYILHLNNWLLKANIGKSFRFPLAKEIGAEGINWHAFRAEIGDSSLSPEQAYQLDIGIEWHKEKFALGITPFINYFSNYLYLNPTSEFYDDTRLQIFNYSEAEVFRYGGEIHAHFELLKSLRLGIIGEHVYSLQLSGEKKGFTLPFSPPPSAILNIKYQKQELQFVENAYISFDYRITAPQYDIVPPEETTDGNQVINLGIGGDMKLRNQKVNITLQVQNLLNTRYFNHTSYYRLINVPGPGRNFIMNISIPFTGKIKQKNNL